MTAPPASAGTRHFRYYDLLVHIFVVVLLISNLVGPKITAIGPFRISGAQLLFPITYIFGDVFTEVYGYGASRRAISERQRAEKDRLRTESVPVSPSPLLRLARHSSVKEINVGVESTLPRWIQVGTPHLNSAPLAPNPTTVATRWTFPNIPQPLGAVSRATRWRRGGLPCRAE